MAPLPPMFESEKQQKLPPESLSPNTTVSKLDESITKSLGTAEIIGLRSTESGIHDMKNGETKQRDCTKTNNGELSLDLLPEYLQKLAASSGVCGDSYAPFSKPEWFDEEKFRRGQRFATKNIFGVLYCELISLMMLFLFQDALEPLIFTGKSDTPFKAFKRYLSTVTRVKSWYEGDIWDVDSVAHKNLKTVRGMHDRIRKNINSSPQDTLNDKVTLFANTRAPPDLVKQHDVIAGDFRSSCPFLKAPLVGSESVYMNQRDMATTQFGFAGLLLLFPDKFGIHGASKEELEGFSHLWRTIGYLLGIEDRYNLYDGDLETVRQRCGDLIEHWVRPLFRTVTRDWLHMSKCVFDGLNYFLPCSTFELILLYLCGVLNINAPKLEASLNIVQYCVYYYSVILFNYLTYLPGVWTFHNWLIHFSMQVFKIVDSCSS